jgi:hypothetical protein
LQILRQLERISGLQMWELFDMIGGTSTGGILAVCLGSLKMSVDECEQVYMSLSHKVFGTALLTALKNILLEQSYHSGVNLENVIRGSFPNHASQTFEDGFPSEVRVFFVTADASNEPTFKERLVRGYRSDGRSPQSLGGVTLCDAIRATSAAFPYLPFKYIKGVPFADGGFVANNPSMMAIAEAQAEQGLAKSPGDAVHALLSLGTGVEMSKSTPLVQYPQMAQEIATAVSVVGALGVFLKFSVRMVLSLVSRLARHLISATTGGELTAADVSTAFGAAACAQHQYVRLQQTMAYAPLDDALALPLLKSTGESFAAVNAAVLEKVAVRILQQAGLSISPHAELSPAHVSSNAKGFAILVLHQLCCWAAVMAGCWLGWRFLSE